MMKLKVGLLALASFFHGRVAPLTFNLPLPVGEVGRPYSWLLVKGGKTPYQCTLTGGALPPGILLNAKTCYLTGTPTQASVVLVAPGAALTILAAE